MMKPKPYMTPCVNIKVPSVFAKLPARNSRIHSGHPNSIIRVRHLGQRLMSGITTGAPRYEMSEALVPTTEMYGLFSNSGRRV
jgi:hypothetical protein